MKNYFKFFLILLLSFFLLGCNKNEDVSNENDMVDDTLDYPSYTVSQLNALDKYQKEEKENSASYKYTYFFDDDHCVNAKVEVKFNSKNDAEYFYNEIDEDEEYMYINISNNIVTYYYNPEYFIYMMYPKDLLIELLSYDFSDES